MQAHAPLAAGSDDVGDYADASDALTCWRSARDSDGGVLHTLYRAARGVHICDIRVHGASLAWLEYRGDDYCKNPDALVTARVVGSCESPEVRSYLS